MAATNLGPVALKPKGGYDAAAEYSRLDVVTYRGGSYVALKLQTGIAPVENTTNENWQCIAQKGEQGIQGEKGDKGNTGDTGPAGKDGTSVTIIDELDSVEKLPETGNTGDSYIIAGHLWTWTRDGLWKDLGEFQGPAGVDGKQGQPGKTAFDSAVEGGYTGTETDFYADLAAMQNLAAELAEI